MQRIYKQTIVQIDDQTPILHGTIRQVINGDMI